MRQPTAPIFPALGHSAKPAPKLVPRYSRDQMVLLGTERADNYIGKGEDMFRTEFVPAGGRKMKFLSSLNNQFDVNPGL